MAHNPIKRNVKLLHQDFSQLNCVVKFLFRETPPIVIAVVQCHISSWRAVGTDFNTDCVAVPRFAVQPTATAIQEFATDSPAVVIA